MKTVDSKGFDGLKNDEVSRHGLEFKRQVVRVTRYGFLMRDSDG